MNTKSRIATMAALIGIALSATAAHSAMVMPAQRMQVMPAQQIFLPIYSLSCVVQGTPVEFPNDVMIRNTGYTTIAAGTWIKWYLHASANGWHQLAQPLAPNQHLFLNNIMGGWPAGASCTAQVQ